MITKNETRVMAGRDQLIANRNKLIADYEWLRRMAFLLDMQTEQIDRQLLELETLLPDSYAFYGDPTENH